jgi:Skp family chaperone for outer membrane proteins
MKGAGIMRNKMWSTILAVIIISLGLFGLFRVSQAQDEPSPPASSKDETSPPVSPTPAAPVKAPDADAPAEITPAIKIGAVNIEAVFEKYRRTADYRKLVEGEKKRLELQIQTTKKRMQDIQEEINLLDQDSELRTEKEMELEGLYNDYERRFKNGNKILKKKSDEQTTKIYKDIREAIEAYAKENNYTLIFKIEPPLPEAPKSDIADQINFRSVLYAQPTLDITNDIIKALNRD